MISTLAINSAAGAYDRARTAIAAQPGAAPATLGAPPAGISSGDRFLQALDAVDQTATGALTGGTSAQTLVQTVAEAELAVETVTAIRDKVVEAYQEILRMPV